MAQVMVVSSAGQDFGGPLRRTTSQPSLLLDTQTQPHVSLNRPDYKASYRLEDASRSSASAPSSAPSSPSLPHIDFSNCNSCSSTPTSSVSLEEYEEDYDDESAYSAYGGHTSKTAVIDYSSMESTPRGSPCRGRSQDEVEEIYPEASPTKHSARSDSMSLTPFADDTAAKPQPTRHVDYLSHNWNEEDIWSSWRHVVSRRGSLDNWERLENASWRTWMKAQRRLSTINPDKLNWMKDHDVTWLYGPLQSDAKHIQDNALRSALSRNDSFIGKKPILKKRCLSEVMLQRSISSQSLMRQATDSIRAQEVAHASARPGAGDRKYSDFAPRSSPISSNNDTVPESPSPMASYASSEVETPDERRRIHFNETVEQCIAISSDDEPDYDETVLEEESEHSSDDEFLTMKAERVIERKLSRTSTPRTSFSDGCGSKTIAMLPNTTLKNKAEASEIPIQTIHPSATHSRGLRESSSQETLRPTRPHANFLLDDDDHDYDFDPEWTPTAKSPAKEDGPTHIRFVDGNSSHLSPDGLNVYRDDKDELQRHGMRRTPSGMFMPYDENDERVAGEGEGVFGKVVDTYNTARDIAHVIWNVGWRR